MLDFVTQTASRKFISAILRHALTMGGGWMISEGYADDETVSQISGGVIALSGVLLSLLDKSARQDSAGK